MIKFLDMTRPYGDDNGTVVVAVHVTQKMTDEEVLAVTQFPQTLAILEGDKWEGGKDNWYSAKDIDHINGDVPDIHMATVTVSLNLRSRVEVDYE